MTRHDTEAAARAATGTSGEPRITAFVELTAELDVVGWGARHAAGQVPDAVPYGFDRLTRYGVDVDVRSSPTSGLVRRAARRVRAAAGGLEVLPAALSAPSARRRSADVVVCWDEYVGVPAALRGSVVGQPVATGVVWLADDPPVGRALQRVVRRGLSRAGAVWAQSTGMLDALREDWAVPTDRLHYVPLGVDTGFFRPGGVPEPGLVVSAGNDRHRDHQLLIRTVGRLQQQGFDCRLELATRHDVDVPVGVGSAGSLDDVRPLYRRACVVAVATRPNLHCSGLTVLLEAMAHGRPVVAFAHRGLDSYVRDGIDGLLVPPGDEEGYVAAVRRLLLDPDGAAQLGASGRDRVERLFSTEHQARALADVVRGAAAGGEP